MCRKYHHALLTRAYEDPTFKNSISNIKQNMKNLLAGFLLLSLALLASSSGCSNKETDEVVPQVLPEKNIFVFDIINNTRFAKGADEVKISLLIEKLSKEDLSLDPTVVLDSTFIMQVQDIPSVLSIRKTVVLKDGSKEVLRACLSSTIGKILVSSLTCRYKDDSLLTTLKISTE
jgi:hypothetical protein